MSNDQETCKADPSHSIRIHDKQEKNVYEGSKVSISTTDEMDIKTRPSLTAYAGNTTDEPFEVLDDIHSYSSRVMTNQIRLYLIRYSKQNSNFVIQALFPSGVKLNFEQSKALHGGDEYPPHVHYLTLNVTPANANHFYVQYNGRSHNINQYSLRMSSPHITGKRHFLDDRKRFLSECPPTWHHFLFNAEFSDYNSTKAPGLQVEFWQQLCLFTFFLLERKDYYTFNTLIEQSKILLERNKIILTNDNFTAFFMKCSFCISLIQIESSDKHTILRDLIRMIGLLNINKNHFTLQSSYTKQSVKHILSFIINNLNGIITLVTFDEWPLFKNGLSIIVCIQLSIQASLPKNATAKNPFTLKFLTCISNRSEIEDIADSILKHVENCNPSILDCHWTELLTMVNSRSIRPKHLEFNRSFQSYFAYIAKYIRALALDNNYKQNIARHFDGLVLNDHFSIDLASIRFLLQILTNKSTILDDKNEETCTIIRSMIDSSVPLRDKITSYFSTLNIHSQDLYVIDEVFQYSNSTLLFHVDKEKFLVRLLTKSDEIRPVNFYSEWFSYFMKYNIGDNQATLIDSNQFKNLLKHWIECLARDYHIFLHIFEEFNRLSTLFIPQENNSRFLHLTEKLIDLFFRKENIYDLIDQCILHIDNAIFIEQFKRKFETNMLRPLMTNVNRSQNNRRPLLCFIELEKTKHRHNRFLRDLIVLSSQIVEVSQEEILRDTFEQPSESSFVYNILFEDWSQTLTIHQNLVDKLIAQLLHWKEQGLRGGEISKWKNYSPDESEVARRIWNSICQKADPMFQLDQFIKNEDEQMNVKFRIKDEITLCLIIYCNNASDQQIYLQYLEDMDKKFESQIVRSIDVPEKITALVPYITHLNAFSESTVWLKFYREKCENRSSVDSSELRIVTDNIPDNQQPTCFALLKEAGQIFDLFINELKSICDKWKTAPISQLIQFFPDSNYIDHDLKTLEPLLNINIAIPFLKEILDFWKSHSHTRHICQGFINLAHHLQIPNSSNLSILHQILKIDDTTAGDIFYQISQDFNTQFSKRYPFDVLNIIAHYSSSDDLVKFLHQLTDIDANNLLEAVNDWDESLINTKTVLDFVLIKTFLDRIYVRIGSIVDEQSTAAFDFNQIIRCFQSILNENEFENIVLCFESCSRLLYSIQQVHLDLTDREQSKRQRILEIMQQSSFSFINKSMKTFDSVEYQFDVTTDIQSTTYADLCELRDRARLIEHSKNEMKTKSNEEIDDLHLFVSLVDLIEVILKSLTLLYISGHPYVSDPFTPCKEFQCTARDYGELQKFSEKLIKSLMTWERHLCAMYEDCLDLTYFSFEQIWFVENYLYNRNLMSKTDPGYHLLKFIDLEPSLFEGTYSREKTEKPVQRLEKIGQILNTHPHSQKSIIDKQTRLIKNVIVTQTSEDGIMRAILSFFNLAKVHGTAKQLFYCTEKTSWIEVRAFIYRCFYSQTIQQLIRPDLLTSSIQSQIIELIRELLKKSSTQSLQLAIITTIPTIDIPLINGLRGLDIVHIYHDQDLVHVLQLPNMIQPYLGNNIFMITSSIAGLGKSTFIRDSILKTNKEYIKFPINGDIHIDLLAKRLSSYADQLGSSTFAIHIDIGTLDNIRQLNEFLYCLLLFRNFRLGQVAVHVPADVSIYIELDASPDAINFYQTILIFKYLKRTHIDQINWNKLEPQKLPGIQWVVNYLYAIENKTINGKDINETTMNHLEDEISSRLLQQYIVREKNDQFITWTKVAIFIAIYNRLFTGFSQCGHFLVDSVNWLQVPQLRMDILLSLLNSSDQFTSVSVEAVRKKQRLTNESNSIDLSEAIIRWDKSQAFTLVFTTTDDPIFVYKKVEDIPKSLIDALNYRHRSILRLYKPEQPNQTSLQSKFFPDYTKLTHAQFFAKLASLSKKYFNKSICLKCFSQYEYKEERCQKCPTHDILVRPRSWNQEDCTRFQNMVADKLQEEYVLTPDNYIKMLLIYLRVQSNLPVLIMGETGCGKTSLIKFLCQKILDDEMIIFRIHAGVTAEKITESMDQFIVQAQPYEKMNTNKRLWIFFDEFNTTTNIGILKEIICEGTFFGRALPKSMVFLGACNPRRYKTGKVGNDDNIGIKKDRFAVQRLANITGSASLLYTVVSIPETMLEYIWDYGFLDEETEKKYVKTMLNSCQLLSSNSKWLESTTALISTSQQYFRTNEDASSVSLRDVARFCRLYNWYQSLIIAREGEEILMQRQIDVYLRSTLMALLCCYYFRLRSPQDRQNYMHTIQEQMKQFMPNLIKTNSFLEELSREEQTKLIEKMELPADTATNRALTENIFVLVACIVNRIPIILCGKPGCSKTSSVQIVISNLKGKKSKVEYFQTLPELITVAYQGSQNCTSESVLKVFERSEKYLKAKKDSNQLLPVIVFDEIGLAELSPHNPLKVLHSELEVESCRYGFVGLSNWRLDASKMNRAIYVSCLDPEINDLQLTAKTILKSMITSRGQGIRLSESIINSLASAYADLNEYINQDEQYNNYFGLRDYYALIKGVIQDSIRAREDPFISIRRQLSINFDGVFNGSHFMWTKFCQYIKRNYLISTHQSPKFKTLLDECLTRRSGRYLMLITENESVIDYVERHIILNDPMHSVRTLTGSCFPGDLDSDSIYTKQYNYRVLMDIILYAETNTTLVMRRMGHLYENLYDLFNQNFSTSAGKKYCRIPLSPLYHPRCLVNEQFYCIVFVQKQDLPISDPPFLSRFEKHIVDMDNLVHPCHKAVTTSLLNWLADLLAINTNKHFPLLQHLFVNYNTNYICNLVIDAYNHLKIPIDQKHDQTDAIMSYCKEKLILTSSFDLPLFLSLRSNDKDKIHPLIEQYYQIHTHLSFTYLLEQNIRNEQISIPNHVIYTYTQLHDIIENIKENRHIREIRLGDFKSELELTRAIRSHYQSTINARLLLVRVDYHLEYKHILLLKYILLNQNIPGTNRGVWIIFHLQRNLLYQVTNDVLFNSWNIVMIDDLNKHKIIPQEILLNPAYSNLISREDFGLTECILSERIDRCLNRFRYITTTTAHEENTIIPYYRHEIINQAIYFNNSFLSLVIQHHLSILMNTIPSHLNDWRRDLLTNGKIIGTSRSLSNAIEQTLSLYYDSYLFLLFTHLEKHSFIDSYLFLTSQKQFVPSNDFYRIWHECLTSTIQSIDQTMMTVEVIELPSHISFYLPCARLEYENIRQIREMDNVENKTTEDFSIDQLNKTSVYEKNFDLIMQNSAFFQYYYHDQLLVALDEVKIIRLTISFVETLFKQNPTRSNVDLIKDFLHNHIELIEILRLFEIAMDLIDEDSLIRIIHEQQSIPSKTTDSNILEIYRLIIRENEFYLIEPRTSEVNSEVFECEGDPLIELSLMNIIERIISSSSIDHAQSIEQINTTYGRIIQGMLSLDSYTVQNLEKLRSFASLARSITTLLSDDRALKVFKTACHHINYDMKNMSYEDIHHFIEYLRDKIKSEEQKVDHIILHEALLKLENEFMKNWLIDHEEQYVDILKSISNSSSDLWQYSARIFTVIDKKLDLLSKTKDKKRQIPDNDEELQGFDHFLYQLNDPTRRIEHLMVNRIHMHLILNVHGNETVENILTNDLNFFERNLRQMENQQTEHGSKLISLTAWLKYYTQLYAFALNHDSKVAIMTTIDRLLTRNDSPFGSTLKLFIVKQLGQLFRVSLDELHEIFLNRTCIWIRPIITQPMNQQSQEIRRSLILPTPLFQCRDEFIRVNKILSRVSDIEPLRQLIHDCSTRQDSAYCFFIWFIHFYARFYVPNVRPDDRFKQLFEQDLHEELLNCFQPIGLKLLISLCTNFNNNSYFSLEPTMNKNEVYQRMLTLNIASLLLSFKALGHSTYLSSFFFDGNLQMPENYTNYLQTSVCLPGFMPTDPVITQMIDVRTQVQERLRRNQISSRGEFIFQCSNECLWMFYFENCGRANDRSQCPLCKKPIGAVKEGVLIERDPPQVQMTIEQAFDFIANHLEKFNQTTYYGYRNTTLAEQSNIGEKSDHLNLSISFRFMHMFTHSILLFLHELDFLTNFPLVHREYLREHFEKDLSLFGQQLADSEESIIWIFNVLNHIYQEPFLVNNFLDTNTKVFELEKLVEHHLILPNIRSVTNVINQYKLTYTNFIEIEDENVTINAYFNELKENEETYPFLSFFNVTTVYTVNPLDEFLVKINLIPDTGVLYPVTLFLMKRLTIYSNIQYLYSIVTFTNYLIEKYNYRIKRNDAVEKTIDYYLRKDDSDHETFVHLYQNFLHAWYKLTFDKVQFGCQTAKLERQEEAEDFAKNTKFATVLLNKSKDISSIALVGCLRTMTELQNEIVHFYHGNSYANTKAQHIVPLQAIQPEHVLRFNADEISTKLITNGFTINYLYGKSKEIIYDFQEIESALCNMISGLPLIDVENLRFFNYQFELYGENSSLINHVRARVKQQSLNVDEHAKFRGLIKGMSNDTILNYLGSLDFVFTYLSSIDKNTNDSSTTIESFIQRKISSAACLNENLLRRPPFSTINLKHIIDLYELLEECAFDQVLSKYVNYELSEEFFTIEQRTEIINDFNRMIFEKDNLPHCFRHPDCWINMFKRLIVRVLMNTNVSVDVPLQVYLQRTDLWTSNVTEQDIESIELSDGILLQHTYIILRGLERKRDKKSLITTDQDDQQQIENTTNLQTSVGQMHQAKAWMPTTSAVPIEISEKKKTGKKLRDKN